MRGVPAVAHMAMTMMMQPKNLSGSRSEATNQRDLCLVTETYPPEVNGVAQTMAHLMDGLRLQGYSVSLVRPRQHSFDSSDYRYQPGATLVRSLPLPGYRGLHIGVPASAACGVVGPSAARISSMSRPKVRWAGRRLALRVIWTYPCSAVSTPTSMPIRSTIMPAGCVF